MTDYTDICETVFIRTKVTNGNPEGVTEINKSDYDANPGKYKLVDAKAPTLPLEQPKTPATPPVWS